MDKLSEFDIVLRRKSNGFVAGIPQLALFAKGEDIQSAIDGLEVKKRELADALLDIGELDRYEKYVSTVPATVIVGGIPLGQFVARAAIVGVVVFLVLSGCGALVLSQTTFNPIRSIERALADAAKPKNDLSEERKQQMVANFKVIVDRWRPVADEVGAVLGRPSDSSNKAQTDN